MNIDSDAVIVRLAAERDTARAELKLRGEQLAAALAMPSGSTWTEMLTEAKACAQQAASVRDYVQGKFGL